MNINLISLHSYIYLYQIIFFSGCNCRKGICDAHGLKSGGIAQLVFHESQQMPPLEVSTEANQNDRLRTSQTYPGAISRKFWTLMQAPETRDRMLNFNF